MAGYFDLSVYLIKENLQNRSICGYKVWFKVADPSLMKGRLHKVDYSKVAPVC